MSLAKFNFGQVSFFPGKGVSTALVCFCVRPYFSLVYLNCSFSPLFGRLWNWQKQIFCSVVYYLVFLSFSTSSARCSIINCRWPICLLSNTLTNTVFTGIKKVLLTIDFRSCRKLQLISLFFFVRLSDSCWAIHFPFTFSLTYLSVSIANGVDLGVVVVGFHFYRFACWNVGGFRETAFDRFHKSRSAFKLYMLTVCLKTERILWRRSNAASLRLLLRGTLLVFVQSMKGL